MRGITLKQIPAGRPGAGIKIVRLHYSADPTMTPERVEKLKSLYPDQSTWDREMEIDPSARSGTRVFPQFDEGIHVAEPAALKPDCYTWYMGADPHMRTAHAFVWLAVDRDGEMVVPYSWWPEERNRLEGMTVKDYANGLRSVFATNLAPEPYRMVMDIAGKGMNERDRDFFRQYQDEDSISRMPSGTET